MLITGREKISKYDALFYPLLDIMLALIPKKVKLPLLRLVSEPYS